MTERGKLRCGPSPIQQRERKMSDYPKNAIRAVGRYLACGYEEHAAPADIL